MRVGGLVIDEPILVIWVINVPLPFFRYHHLLGALGAFLRVAAREIAGISQGHGRLGPSDLLGLSAPHSEAQICVGDFLKAQERNRPEVYQREHKSRQWVAEGTFVSLDRLSWARSRPRRLWNCEGYMASLAHNGLKAMLR